MFKPLISVVTPVYNGEKFLLRNIECVIHQEGSLPVEHIIIDDASTDNSLSIARHYQKKYSHIKIISFKDNRGVAAARREAVKVASGKYIAFLDADDLWTPQKLSIQYKFMEKMKISFSFTDYRLMTEDGSLVGRCLRGPKKIGWSMHHMTRYIGCLGVMVEKSKIPVDAFQAISSEYRAEDFLAWSKIIAAEGYAVRCPYDLGRYTVSKGSRSSDGILAAKSVWKLYRDIERLGFWYTLLCFVVYVLFASGKRCVYRPLISRDQVDTIVSY